MVAVIADIVDPPAFLLLPPLRRLSRLHDTLTHRQHQQFSRSPASSVDFDALYLRLGALAPTSPADTAGPASTSPPMSDFGMDLGQSSASHGQATVNRSRSFSAGTSLLFGERVGDGQLAAQLGLSGRGRHSSTDRCSTLREEASQVLFKYHVVTRAPKSLLGSVPTALYLLEEHAGSGNLPILIFDFSSL